jgi:Domain of unknown function (DUF4124)
MDTRRILFRLATALLASTLALPAASGVLYKSIDADGTIMLSDVPPPSEGQPMLDDDAPVACANALFDLAEHAFAIARRDLWSPSDGLRMSAARRSRGDMERVEFYKRDVLLARARLLERLRERQATASPYQVASR